MKDISLMKHKKPKKPHVGDVVLEGGEFLMWDGYSWIPIQMEPHDDSHRLEELIDEFEKNPDLFNQVMVEMRKRKINNIKNNSKT